MLRLSWGGRVAWWCRLALEGFTLVSHLHVFMYVIDYHCIPCSVSHLCSQLSVLLFAPMSNSHWSSRHVQYVTYSLWDRPILFVYHTFLHIQQLTKLTWSSPTNDHKSNLCVTHHTSLVTHKEISFCWPLSGLVSLEQWMARVERESISLFDSLVINNTVCSSTALSFGVSGQIE